MGSNGILLVCIQKPVFFKCLRLGLDLIMIHDPISFILPYNWQWFWMHASVNVDGRHDERLSCSGTFIHHLKIKLESFFSIRLTISIEPHHDPGDSLSGYEKLVT